MILVGVGCAQSAPFLQPKYSKEKKMEMLILNLLGRLFGSPPWTEFQMWLHSMLLYVFGQAGFGIGGI